MDIWTIIFLVGINNDWTYQIAPVGLICIDNSAPKINYSVNTNNMLAYEYSFDPVMNHHDLLFNKNKIIVRMPENAPVIEGVVYLSTTGFSGYSNVNFQLYHRGDVKNITLVRENNLARWVGRGKKVINLQDVSNPYLFSYELNLDFGVNYLPVIVTNLRGNTTE